MLIRVVKNIQDVALQQADGLEIRVDGMSATDLLQVKALIEKKSCPIILSIRKRCFSGSESEWRARVKQLFELTPHFIELSEEDPLFLQQMAALYPEVKIIGSFCHLEGPLDSFFEQFSKRKSPVFYAYKLVAMGHSSLDALKMMLFVREQTALGIKISGICTEEKGSLTTILGAIYRNLFTYIPENQSGLTLDDLLHVYHYRALNAETSIYGLIGHSVGKSLTHFAHNAVIQALGLNAIYVKISLLPEELPEFFMIAKKLGIRGLSVTMPFKELVLAYLDEIDGPAKEIRAVNTIVFEQGLSYGFNTDGDAALDVIEKKMPTLGKKVVLIGAGGAAKAIAYVANQRGAQVVILNCTLQKAKDLAVSISARGGDLKQMAEEHQLGYDILINCTPEPCPIDPQFILSDALIMDIKTIPSQDSLLEYAKERGATVIYGYEMFIHQAVAQVNIWFKEKGQKCNILDIITTEVTYRMNLFKP